MSDVRAREDREGQVAGANAALSTLAHELASPLTALYTYLNIAERKLAGEPVLAKIRACTERLSAIVALAQAVKHDRGAPVMIDLVVALRDGAPEVVVEGAASATIDRRTLDAVIASLRFAAGPTRAQLAQVADGVAEVHVDRGRAPAGWRAVDAFGDAKLGFDVWSLAMLCSRARVGDLPDDGSIAIAVTLP